MSRSSIPSVMAGAAPQGLLVTAGTVHLPFKSELLTTLSLPRFSRVPHLVGILATKKEDARTYAEVSRAQAALLSLSMQFARKACEKIGIEFELRSVGEAGAGIDGKGVGVDVEEAILVVNQA